MRFGNSPDMVGTLHRQFTELLITATACKRTKNGGKRNHAQKTDQNPALEGDSESGKQHVGAIIFRNPELFHPHKWQLHDPNKKHERELGRRSLKNYNKQTSSTRAKTSFPEKKKKKIIKMAFLSPTCGNTRTQYNHLRIKNRFPKLQCRRKLVSCRGDGEEAKREEEER